MLKDFTLVLGILLYFSFIIYLVLFFAYQFYLKSEKGLGGDSFSRMIGYQVSSLQNLLIVLLSFMMISKMNRLGFM